MKPIIFLDRDGVINYAKVIDGKPTSPKTLSDLRVLDGVIEAIDILKTLNFEIFVVTNQPDISRKLLSESQNNQIHRHLSRILQLENFYTCPHCDEDDCGCRKPKTGLLTRALKNFESSTLACYMVGDRRSDIKAGQAIGAKCFFIDYDYDEPKPEIPFSPVKSLLEATLLIRKDFYHVSN